MTLGIKVKGKATITWGHELVEDPDAGNFYMRVYPVLKNFRVDNSDERKAQLKRIAKEILAEAAAGRKNIKVNK
jgi:hypothetical protein